MMWQVMGANPFVADPNLGWKLAYLAGIVAAEMLVLLLLTLVKLGKARAGGRDYATLKRNLDYQDRRIAKLVPLPGGVMLSASFVDPPKYLPGTEPYRQVVLEQAAGIVDGGENSLLISRVYLIDGRRRHILGPPVDVVRFDPHPGPGPDTGRLQVKLVFRPCTFEQPFTPRAIALATPDNGVVFEHQPFSDDVPSCGVGESLTIEVTWTPELPPDDTTPPPQRKEATPDDLVLHRRPGRLVRKRVPGHQEEDPGSGWRPPTGD